MDTTDQLNNFSSAEFEQWLHSKLLQFYSPDPTARYIAFDFRHLDIPFGESHIEQLVALFNRLAPSAQLSFRNGAQRILRHAEIGSFPLEAMRDVIVIIGLVRAHQAMESFVPVLGNGPWGEKHQSLIYDALSVLLMFDRTDEAYDAAKGLATSAYFPDAYTFDAYLILARSKPRKWVDDLALLRERLVAYRRRIASGPDKFKALLRNREGTLAESLVQAVPLADLGDQLAKLQLSPPDTRDQWLFDRLFGIGAPLKLEYGDMGMRLVDHKSLRQADVPTTEEFEVFCISYGYVFDELRSAVAEEFTGQLRARLDTLSRRSRSATIS